MGRAQTGQWPNFVLGTRDSGNVNLRRESICTNNIADVQTPPHRTLPSYINEWTIALEKEIWYTGKPNHVCLRPLVEIVVKS